jgi:hypothetical protein
MSQPKARSPKPNSSPKAVGVPANTLASETAPVASTRAFEVSYTPTGDLVLSGGYRDPDLGEVRYFAVLGQDPATLFGYDLREGNPCDEAWDFDDVTGWVSVEGTRHDLDRINAYTADGRSIFHLDFLIGEDERGEPSGNVSVAELDRTRSFCSARSVPTRMRAPWAPL